MVQFGSMVGDYISLLCFTHWFVFCAVHVGRLRWGIWPMVSYLLCIGQPDPTLAILLLCHTFRNTVVIILCIILTLLPSGMLLLWSWTSFIVLPVGMLSLWSWTLYVLLPLGMLLVPSCWSYPCYLQECHIMLVYILYYLWERHYFGLRYCEFCYVPVQNDMAAADRSSTPHVM